ncbi:S41 family peptidase [Porticoccus sp. W117]|uniref:S41 family peptidase n=1 Tax=Porticoccus sp. W117 TaxID=3054777 RepID=UPI00259A6AFA|nr:S41 family peptidase [Porticoccus sp. W117]MDM3872075.1 S41 family peptidase [Porticoccus sp. W117]
MHCNRRLRQLAIALPLTLLLGSPLNAAESEQESAPKAQLPLEELRAFTQIFDHIRKSYVEEVDDRTLLQNAINGLLGNLDPHSTYLNEEAFAQLQKSSNGEEFSGIGIEVDMEDNAVLVVAPIDDSPATKAGIRAGDRIIKIGDKLVKGLNQDEAIALMRGPRGTQIMLTIVRKGSARPLTLELTRDTIKSLSVRSRILEPGYGYIRIAQFQVETGEQFRNSLLKLMGSETPFKGLILDLRNNPGGVLPAAVEVADTLLDGGMVTYTKGRLPSSNTEYEASSDDITGNIPVVVLIDGGSASASEIVAGALQDHRRAIVVGTRSFGKGSVQSVVQISETEGVKLTTARYFTPSGRSIQATGIQPDIVIKRADIVPVEGSDYVVSESSLRGHLSNPGKDSAQSDDKDSAEDIMDNQLVEGLNVLKGVYILSRKD